MIDPAFVAHERRRWMRPDAANWLRPDVANVLKPGTDPADVYPALAHEREVLDGLRCELVKVFFRFLIPWL